MITVNGVVLLRRDVEATWAYVNPMIADGEAALSTDIKNFKVGPGLWADLDYWIQSNAAPDAHTIVAGVTNTPLTIPYTSATAPRYIAVKTSDGSYDWTLFVQWTGTGFTISQPDDGAGHFVDGYSFVINP